MGDIQVASTTDNQEEVNRVAGTVGEVVEEKPEEKPTEQPEPEKPKPDDKIQKRIDKLVAQRSEAERRAEQLAKELEAERAKHVEQQEPEEPVEVPQAVLRPRPKLGETVNPRTGKPHETQEEYEDDLMDWRDEKRYMEYAKEEQEQKRKEVLGTYQERVEAFKASHEDWDAVVGANIEIPIGVQMAILEMDNGPEMAYFLGTHPQVCKDLMKMSEARAVAEIGRLSARLEVPAEKEEREEQKRGPDRQPVVSKAPAPIRQLSGHATKSSVPLDQLDYSEFRKIRDQQEKSRFRR